MYAHVCVGDIYKGYYLLELVINSSILTNLIRFQVLVAKFGSSAVHCPCSEGAFPLYSSVMIANCVKHQTFL